ncbi:MAG: hypothetical protein IT178_17245 [Acidobacteria bacterium]|nr:hypothetical protein [Acidobacteriota bacterium]
MSGVRSERGISLVEVLIVAGILGTLAAIGVGVSNTIVRTTKAQAGPAQIDSFLKRHREMAIARRRDIEIQFIQPNQLRSLQRAIPNPPAATPAPEVLETITLEGGAEYIAPGMVVAESIVQPPNALPNGAWLVAGGAGPHMFSSDGQFTDAAGNPRALVVSMSIANDPLTLGAVTIMGASAMVERWQWNGREWTK